MKRQSKLSIAPDDSKNENFTLSLVDFFHKELANRGIESNKKASFVEIKLPSIYEEKYDRIIVDCNDGKVYLRGNECKDKMFGKLSRFNPQRKSDAYNCVNYSVTRLVNRINKLIDSFSTAEKTVTASTYWLSQKNQDGTEDSYAFTDSEEEALKDSVINPEVDPEAGKINIIETENPEETLNEVVDKINNEEITDLRDIEDMVTNQYETTGHQRMIVEVPEGVNPQEYIMNLLHGNMLDARTANFAWVKERDQETKEDLKTTLWIDDDLDAMPQDLYWDLIADIYYEIGFDQMDEDQLDIRYVDDANLSACQYLIESAGENEVASNIFEDKSSEQSEKIASKEYVHYFPSNQPKIDKFLDENPSFKELESEYGKCTNIFDKDGIVTYEKEIDFPDDEVKKWCKLWGSVIKSAFSDFSGEKRNDIDLDEENALIILWTNNLSECKFSQENGNNDYKDVPGKIFFRIKIKGIKVTSLDLNGNKAEDDFFSPDSDLITFEYVGEKV